MLDKEPTIGADALTLSSLLSTALIVTTPVPPLGLIVILDPAAILVTPAGVSSPPPPAAISSLTRWSIDLDVATCASSLIQVLPDTSVSSQMFQ